jgi:hypothetical protein
LDGVEIIEGMVGEEIGEVPDEMEGEIGFEDWIEGSGGLLDLEGSEARINSWEEDSGFGRGGNDDTSSRTKVTSSLGVIASTNNSFFSFCLSLEALAEAVALCDIRASQEGGWISLGFGVSPLLPLSSFIRCISPLSCISLLEVRGTLGFFLSSSLVGAEV